MLMDWNPKPPSLWDWDIDAGPVLSTSSKSTISASVDSSALVGPPQDQPIGLKLGKRTYFEDVCAGVSSSDAKNKRACKVSNQTAQTFRCQVEGCNVDLAGAKDYHRKHRVCESHSKFPRVIVAGQERRFCQQCSRFHDLAAFDDKKRSCRKRLSDHNARRRKQQPETMLSSQFYADSQQMNLPSYRAPFGQIRLSATSSWEDSCDFKLADMKGSWMKSTKGDNEGQLLLPGTDFSNAFNTLRHDLDRILPFKGTTAEVINQGHEEASVIGSNLNGPQDLRRALSLLSTDSWVPAGEPEGPTASLPQQLMLHGNQFQEFQLLRAPYEAAFFDSSQIH